MPYGVPNERPEQTKWLEKCVGSVMKQNPKYKESRAIAICKAQLKNNNWKVKKGDAELSIREGLYELEKKIRDAIDLPSSLPESGVYVDDVFDDYVIVNKDSKLYKINWSMSGDVVSVDWNKAIEVERVVSYEPVKSESEREITTDVPSIKGDTRYRRVTWGPRTI